MRHPSLFSVSLRSKRIRIGFRLVARFLHLLFPPPPGPGDVGGVGLGESQGIGDFWCVRVGAEGWSRSVLYIELGCR